METRTMILIAVGVVVLIAAAWFYSHHTSGFDPTQVESFRLNSGGPNMYEFVMTTESRPYQDGAEKKSEFIWKSRSGSSNLIMYRDQNVWNIAIVGGVRFMTSVTVDKYPFLCEWLGQIVEVQLKGKTDWTPIKSLLSPPAATA
jgi:hypothetical protein